MSTIRVIIIVAILLVLAWIGFDLNTVVFGVTVEDDFCSYNDCGKLANTVIM